MEYEERRAEIPTASAHSDKLVAVQACEGDRMEYRERVAAEREQSRAPPVNSSTVWRCPFPDTF